jgi:hypothetical protein
MKGNKAVILVILIAMIAISAVVVSITLFYQNNQTQNGQEMSIDGTVAKIEDQRVLVISGKVAEELKDKSEVEMLEGIQEAIWFSLSIDQLKIVNEYDYVRITFSQVNESFPGQANANNIEILSQKPTK